jgi:hypothetical protein
MLLAVFNYYIIIDIYVVIVIFTMINSLYTPNLLHLIIIFIITELMLFSTLYILLGRKAFLRVFVDATDAAAAAIAFTNAETSLKRSFGI